jgi:hypothetical protein
MAPFINKILNIKVVSIMLTSKDSYSVILLECFIGCYINIVPLICLKSVAEIFLYVSPSSMPNKIPFHPPVVNILDVQ